MMIIREILTNRWNLHASVESVPIRGICDPGTAQRSSILPRTHTKNFSWELQRTPRALSIYFLAVL